MAALNLLSLVQRNRFAVLPDPDHVVAKVGLVALLFKVELDLRAANEMGDQAARDAIQQRHPHHEARNAVAATRQRERKVA